MKGLKRSRLIEILDSFGGLKAIVVGDFALDVYWYADMTRSELSRETPHHIRPVVRETYSPGASGNICCNVKALGLKDVFAITVIGDDWRGRILNEKLKESGVALDYLITFPKRVTPTYIKPILCGWDSQQEDSRIDFMNYSPMSKECEERLIENIGEAVQKVDLVIVEDQMTLNGVVTERIRSDLIQFAKRNPEKVFVVDSRERIGLFTDMVLKPNRMEAVRAVWQSRNPNEVDMDQLLEAGKELQRRVNRPVYVTLSENGALVITSSSHHHVPAVPTKPPIDPVGAGDTFISALGASLAVGSLPVEACIIANLAAAVILKKLNTTGTASPQEILYKFDEVARGDEWP